MVEKGCRWGPWEGRKGRGLEHGEKAERWAGKRGQTFQCKELRKKGWMGMCLYKCGDKWQSTRLPLKKPALPDPVFNSPFVSSLNSEQCSTPSPRNTFFSGFNAITLLRFLWPHWQPLFSIPCWPLPPHQNSKCWLAPAVGPGFHSRSYSHATLDNFM